MPRLARIVIPGLPHHVTQRGNHRQDVFLREEDRTIYLELLQAQAALYSLTRASSGRGTCGRTGSIPG